MPEKKGLFGGLFGGKEEPEEAKKAPAKKIETAGKSIMDDINKTKAEMVKKQEEQKKAAEAVKKHVVVKGDTLSGIAKKYYDDAGKYMKIYEANKAVIGSNPDLIKPGMELIIPKL
jgi:nucleoid-associated protein YgaU